MFRYIYRTSRCLVRYKINTFKPVLPLSYSAVNLLVKNCGCVAKKFSTTNITNSTNQEQVDAITFDNICSETLNSLCDYFEELVESAPNLKGADVTYGDGVLTVQLGAKYGTYVINRQTPNKQIWLSSPTSGPKRYDLINENGGYWVYKHNGETLHKLLQDEISKIAETKVDFKNCLHSLL